MRIREKNKDNTNHPVRKKQDSSMPLPKRKYNCQGKGNGRESRGHEGDLVSEWMWITSNRANSRIAWE